MTRALLKTLRDIFSPNVILFVLPIGIVSALVWFIPLWKLEEGLMQWISHLFTWIPSIGRYVKGDRYDSFWVTLATGHILISITVSIATALFGKNVLRNIARKHYAGFDHKGGSNPVKAIYHARKANCIFLCWLIVAFPLLFVPYIGAVWMMILWFLQLSRPTTYRVETLLDYDKDVLKKYRWKGRLVVLFSVLLNFIPIANFFTPLFAQIWYLHTILGEETRRPVLITENSAVSGSEQHHTDKRF